MINNKIKVGMVGISFGMEFIPIYLKHPDVYEIMCKNARKYVDDYFQWDDIMKKFDDIIAKVGKTTA